MTFLLFNKETLGISTYSEREDGLSQLLRLLLSLLNRQVGALLHVTELPLMKNVEILE